MNHIEFFIQQVEAETEAPLPILTKTAMVLIVWRMNGLSLSVRGDWRFLKMSYTGVYYTIKFAESFEKMECRGFTKLYNELSSLYLKSTYSWLRSIKYN